LRVEAAHQGTGWNAVETTLDWGGWTGMAPIELSVTRDGKNKGVGMDVTWE
jgi:hypothetical protein